MKKILKSVFAIAIAALTFTSCDDVPMPYDTPKENSGGTTYDGAAGTGTLADPYNVAGVLQFISTLEAGVESENPVYIKGTIISIDEEYSTNFGNATFNITDAGTNYTFTVYRALYLGNKKFSSGDTQIKIGDEVIVYGTVLSYRGNTPETQQNKAYLYSLNGITAGGEGGGGETGTPKGDGTLNNPYNPAGVIAYINTLGADKESVNDVYIKGKVASISENYSTQYGNATFTIVEEGAEGTTFTVYRALYLGYQKYTSGDLLKQNDEVIICGKVVNYKGNTPETSANNSYLYSLNGKTESGGSTPTPSGNGTEESPFNVLKALEFTKALGKDQESAENVYVKGKISSIKYTYSAQYGTATYNISDDGSTTNEFTVYGSYYLNNQPWKDGDTQIQIGDEVLVCGKVVNYKGDTPEFANKKNWLVSINSNGGGSNTGGNTATGGNTTKNVNGTTVTLTNPNATEGSSVTIDFGTQGFENGKQATTITLNDGTTISFDKGANSNAPSYYDATKGVRVYAQNSIIINGSKAIAKVVMNCDSYNGTNYVGNSMLYGEVSGKTFTIVNDNTEPKGGVQLRVQTMIITYAN